MPMQTQNQKADSAIVPVEGPVEGPANKTDRDRANASPSARLAAPPYGPNNEQLPERLPEALRRLVV